MFSQKFVILLGLVAFVQAAQLAKLKLNTEEKPEEELRNDPNDPIFPKASNSICLLAKDTGPCRAYFERYYYDNTEKQCKQFIYGGCEGNANRFDSEQECNKACSGA